MRYKRLWLPAAGRVAGQEYHRYGDINIVHWANAGNEPGGSVKIAQKKSNPGLFLPTFLHLYFN